MPKRKKSGRITLRMDPEIHARVETIAKSLGMDINGLLNLIIRRGLVMFQFEAKELPDLARNPLFRTWVRLNPTGFPGDYFSDKSQMFFGIPVQFEDGKRYLLSDNWQEFVEVKE